MSDSQHAENKLHGKPKHLPSCDPYMKLGNNCDVCQRGIMLPPGGVAYYEELAKSSNPRPPKGQDYLICTRCGHWHRLMGPEFSSG